MSSELEQLQKENEVLKKSIQELEQASKMLVRRDIDLQQAYEELRQLDKEKSEFVSIAAHQLRTPLTTVSFANQMLIDALRSDLDETQLDIFHKSRVGIENMFEIIEELLVVDALDYGNLKLSYEPVVLEQLIDEIMIGFADIIKQKSLAIHTDYSDAPQVVQADKTRIKASISNVIDNAIKYTLAGGSITLATKYVESSASITVSDTGIGIEATEAQNLFKKFSRFDNAIRIDANGSGLGLYISKKIAEKHKGDLSFVPNGTKGSSFIIKIPIKEL